MEKKKLRFNAVDVFIVLIVLAVIAVALYVLLSEKDAVVPESETRTIRYTLIVSEMDEIFVNNVKEGDTIYDADSFRELGKVVEVSSKDSMRLGTDLRTGANKTDKEVLSTLEKKKDLLITVEADATFTKDQYFVSDVNIAVGAGVRFAVPQLTMPAVVMGVTYDGRNTK